MSLLEEIRDAAVNSQSDLGEVLRKCKVLAASLGSKPLEDWLIWECNGYPDDVKLPEYRVWKVELIGHFCNRLGEEVPQYHIPNSFIPEQYRDQLTTNYCRSSISAIEKMLTDSSGPQIGAQCNAARSLFDNLIVKMSCLSLWQDIPSINILELRNTVRNRVLDFVLALWKENPEAGETQSDSAKIESKTVTQIFNTTIHQGSANIVGNAQDSIITQAVEINNWESLENALKEKGIKQEDIDELKEAIESDPIPESSSKFGPLVSGWIGKMVGKAAKGLWDIGVSTAGSLLATAICKYYGV